MRTLCFNSFLDARVDIFLYQDSLLSLNKINGFGSFREYGRVKVENLLDCFDGKPARLPDPSCWPKISLVY